MPLRRGAIQLERSAGDRGHVLVSRVPIRRGRQRDRKRYAGTMGAIPIEQMSWDEKLRAMEELWASLSSEGSRLESPAWHEAALAETAARYNAGVEKPQDWASAKQDLRARLK